MKTLSHEINTYKTNTQQNTKTHKNKKHTQTKQHTQKKKKIVEE